MKLEVDGRAAWAYTGGKPFDPTRPVVALVHGAMNDHSVWTLVARWLANHGHAVLAVDLPGHGRSEGPPLATVEQMAGWLRHVLDAAGVDRAAFVGHSMGSLVALEAAAGVPERASRLVMVATAYPMAVSPALLDTARSDPLTAIDRVTGWSHSTHAAKPSYPGPGSWLHGGSRRLMRRLQDGWPDGNLFAVDFAACDAYRGGETAMARVACPTTLVIGGRDQMTDPRSGRRLAAPLNARVIELAGGHQIMAEAPDAVIDAVAAALA